MKKTEKQQNQLKEVVRLELLKRGFTCEIETFEIDKEKGSIYLKTNTFQTVPLIFKESYIKSFFSGMDKDGNFLVNVKVNYVSFLDEQNSVGLFAMTGTFSNNDIFDLNIKQTSDSVW